MLLDSKVALVTGSSRGIGRRIAEDLAANGAKVAVNYRKSRRSGENVVETIVDRGGTAEAFQADVSDAEQASGLIQAVVDRFEKLDILVNNAGMTRDQLLLRMTQDDWQQVIEVNLSSVFHCSQAAVRPMMRQRQGVIINMASVAGVIGNPGQTNYAAAKAGIIGFSRSLAKEMGTRGIRVNVVAPGWIKTDLTSELEQRAEEIRQAVPLGRHGSAADVAHLVTFLASERSSYMTGQVIAVDGGLTMGG